MGSLGCVTRGGTPLPAKIEDTATLKLSYDNQGFVILNITILTKNVAPITTSNFKYSLNDKEFTGFIDSDSPRKLEGSEYYEHNITAKGHVCGGGGGANVA